MDTKIDFKDPAYYENRELSWIKFDQRVLSEARDKSIPLLERLKFVSITSSNLDEFFMVRVASLKDMVQFSFRSEVLQYSMFYCGSAGTDAMHPQPSE